MPDFSQIVSYAQQGFGIAQQLAQQFGGARGSAAAAPQPPTPGSSAAAAPPAGPAAATAPSPATELPEPGHDMPAAAAPATTDAPSAPNTSGSPADALALLLSAIQQRQIPSVTPAAPPPAPPSDTSAPAQRDALAMLRTIVTNPQFQQAMQVAARSGVGGRAVDLRVPPVSRPRRRRRVRIPLGAVMNAIGLLARRATAELNATTQQNEPAVPEYLVDEQGEFIVDPTEAAERASLVALMFELHDAAEQAERIEEVNALDEQWTEDVGYTM